DPGSLSGYFSVLFELERRGLAPDHFASAAELGSHHAALAAVAQGRIDCAAIDSNTLLLEQRAGRQPRVRVLESYGPYPVQPVVVRSALSAELQQAIADALLAMHADPAGARVLAQAGVLRFAPVDPRDYDFERALLGRVGGAYAGAACAREPGSR
ncbi:MAG: PhnD/SsuA/transferrin family substrate-binding protein, partial [Planctomycetota bacterium]